MSCDELRDRIAASAALDGEVERHLESCAACRAEAIELRRAATILRAAHVLESTRARRAPLFAARPRRPLRWIAAAAVAAAIVIACVLALRPRAPLAWSGDAQVVALGPGRARLESGRARFESSGAFEIETRLARLTGERAAFTATLVAKGDDVSSKRKLAAGGAAAAALIVAVEWGRVDVQRAGGPAEPVAAGETRTIEAAPPPREEPTAEPRETALPIPKSGTPAPSVEPTATDGEKRGSVHGLILFDDGAPVANELVWLWGDPHVVARTDDQGFFRIERDWLSSRPRTLMVGPEDVAVAAGEVVLVADEDHEVRFTLVRGVDLEILVVNEATDEPIPRIPLALRRQDDPFDREPASGWACATTDASGAVCLRHLHLEPYVVDVSAKGWRHYRERIDLAKPAERPHRVRLHPADPLVIHVEGWSLGTSASAQVQLMPGRSGDWEERFGQVDARGEFVTDAPMPGQYIAQLSCNGWTATSSAFTVPERGAVEVRVEQPRGASVDGVLVAAPAESSWRGEVRLRALEGGDQVQGALDASGNFHVEHVAPGRHRLDVELETQGVVGAPDVIEVPEGGLSGVVVRLSGGTVEGRVVGAPESGLVRTSRREGEEWIYRGYLRPDVDGSFRGKWLAPGQWRLTPTRSAGGYAPSVDVDVELDRTTAGVRLVWRSCPESSFVLRRADGSPVGGRQVVMLTPKTSGGGWGATTFDLSLDEQGRATVREIPPGSWKLRFSSGAEATIDVADGENPPIELVVP
jgi:hypothetical protein